MTKLRCHISISADGYVAGPDQSMEEPLGVGGMRLHDWAISLAAWRAAHGMPGGEVNASTPVMEGSTAGVGAGVMGRNMFGPVGAGTGAMAGGRAGGETTRPTTTTSSSSPIIRASRSP